jgi:hypothetical protein
VDWAERGFGNVSGFFDDQKPTGKDNRPGEHTVSHEEEKHRFEDDENGSEEETELLSDDEEMDWLESDLGELSYEDTPPIATTDEAEDSFAEDPAEELAEDGPDQEQASPEAEDQGEEDLEEEDLEEDQDPLIFTDSFITFPRQVTIPAVELNVVNIKQTMSGVAVLELTNNSDFDLQVLLRPAAKWLTVPAEPLDLPQGKPVELPLGLDLAHARPGCRGCELEIVLRGAMVEIVYVTSVSATFTSKYPYPELVVKPRKEKKRLILDIQIRNVGLGILKGIFYDRARNKQTDVELGLATEPDAQGAVPAAEFSLSVSFSDPTDVQGGFVFMSNCPARAFRALTINPWDYFPQPQMTDLPFLDFLELDGDGGVFRDLRLIDRAFHDQCDIKVPMSLKRYLSAHVVERGVVRFSLAQGARALGNRTGFVEFQGKGKIKTKVPVLISFVR